MSDQNRMIILIISAIAAFGFSATAKKKGYDSTRFWIYPLAVGVGTYIVAFVLNMILPRITGYQGSEFSRAYPFVVGIFSLVLVLSLISKAWKQIRFLPDRRKNDQDVALIDHQ
jgi:xanthine/uracil permease